MGIVSEFRIEVSTHPFDRHAFFEKPSRDVLRHLEEVSVYPYKFADKEGYLQCAKWYSFQDDMEKLSYEYPTVLFSVYRNCEELEEEAYYYFLNGCSAKIERPPWPDTGPAGGLKALHA